MVEYFKEVSGSNGGNTGSIGVEVQANTGIQRTATITITADGSTGSQMTVSIAQAAKEAELQIDPEIQTVDFEGAAINQDISNGINTTKTENKLNVYPNPMDKQCTVQIEEFNGIPKKLEVFNMMGQFESYQSLNQERTIIDLSSLQQGIYQFRVTSETNILSQRRVVKN